MISKTIHLGHDRAREGAGRSIFNAASRLRVAMWTIDLKGRDAETHPLDSTEKVQAGFRR
jgi:hypothetical protein